MFLKHSNLGFVWGSRNIFICEYISANVGLVLHLMLSSLLISIVGPSLPSLPTMHTQPFPPSSPVKRESLPDGHLLSQSQHVYMNKNLTHRVGVEETNTETDRDRGRHTQRDTERYQVFNWSAVGQASSFHISPCTFFRAPTSSLYYVFFSCKRNPSWRHPLTYSWPTYHWWVPILYRVVASLQPAPADSPTWLDFFPVSLHTPKAVLSKLAST